MLFTNDTVDCGRYLDADNVRVYSVIIWTANSPHLPTLLNSVLIL